MQRGSEHRPTARLRAREGEAGAPGTRWAGALLPALSALLLALATAGAALAQPIAVLSAPIGWLGAIDGGVVALLEDGRVIRAGRGGVQAVASGWQGEALVPCGGRIYGIDAAGRLVAARGPRPGPRVSLHSTPLCLPDGSLLAISAAADTLYHISPDLRVDDQRPLEALADTEIVTLGGAAALLTEPTMRYRHGVLGDEVEAGAVALIDPGTLADLGSFRVEEPWVIEQRRVLPFGVGGIEGLFLTRSSHELGAEVMALVWGEAGLEPLAVGGAIGTGNRWLNLFAVREERAYAVRTPHIGGELERYRLDGDSLTVERFDLGITNHIIGSRNLDLGILLPDLVPGSDLLVLPRNDLRSLRLIACDGDGCRLLTEYPLLGRLAGNPVWVETADGLYLYVGDSHARLYRFELELP